MNGLHNHERIEQLIDAVKGLEERLDRLEQNTSNVLIGNTFWPQGKKG